MVERIRDLAERIHSIAVDHGWWGEDNRSFGELIALIHSECSEALEAYREKRDEDIPEELADIVIRTFDMAAGLGYDIEEAILKKVSKNEMRTHRHGGKRL